MFVVTHFQLDSTVVLLPTENFADLLSITPYLRDEPKLFLFSNKEEGRKKKNTPKSVSVYKFFFSIYTSSKTVSLNSRSTFWPDSSDVDSPCRDKRAPRSNLGDLRSLTLRMWTYGRSSVHIRTDAYLCNIIISIGCRQLIGQTRWRDGYKRSVEGRFRWWPSQSHVR